MQLLREKIEKICEEARQKGVFSGCAVGVADIADPQKLQILQVCQGGDDPEAALLHVRPHTVFDVASVTKAFVGTLALDLILQGRLSPDARVMDYLPGLATSHNREVLVRHLLTHTLDFRFSLAAHKNDDFNEILDLLLGRQFDAPPGSLFCYCNASSILLGMVVETVSGFDLDILVHNRIFAPLNMEHSGYHPDEFADPFEIMPTEECDWRGRVIRGEVHDESAYALIPHGVVGSAGIFSSVSDLLKFCTMILADGEYEGRRILPPGILRMASTNAIPHLEQTTALGWELQQDRFMGTNPPANRFGKTGFTGSSLVLDPDQKRALVILSNFTWPKREPTADRINEFRTAVADIVFS